MALSDSTRDRLLSIKTAAQALSQFAESAADNANSDDLSADPLMRAVRQGYLMVQSIGSEFLTLDRAGVLRVNGSAVISAINALSVQQAIKDAINAEFTSGATYSETQIENRLFPFVVAGNLSSANLTTVGGTLGMDLVSGGYSG